MTKRIYLTLPILLLVLSTYAQTNGRPPGFITYGTDVLGRKNQPSIAILPPVGVESVPSSVVQSAGEAFQKGLGFGTSMPFATIKKEKFDEVRLILPYMEKSEIAKSYRNESIPCEYLGRLEVNRLKSIVEKDTIRQDPKNPKSTIVRVKNVYHFFANVSITITEVATSKMVINENLHLVSNSRESTANSPAADSIAGLNKIYDQLRNHASQSYLQLLGGVGTIDSLVEEKKEKAKYVRVDLSKILNLPQLGTTFDVYELGEKFIQEGIEYQHVQKIGYILREDGYRYDTRLFKVMDGGKRIAELLKAGIKPVCVMGQFPLSAKSPEAQALLPSLLVDTFQYKVKGSPELARMLQETLISALSTKPQMLNLVNRKVYDDIETERAIHSKSKYDGAQAGITIGADYVLSAEIQDYSYKKEPIKKTIEKTVEPPKSTTPAPATKPAATPPPASTDSKTRGESAAKPATTTPAPAAPKPQVIKETIITGTKVNAGIRVDAKLISVKTGEIIWSKLLEGGAEKDFPLDAKVSDKHLQLEMLNTLLASNFASGQVFAFLQGIARPLPILKVVELNKKGVDKIMIGGGSLAGITPYMALQVIEETIEVVDNQSLKRETVVAELRSDEIFPETSIWNVKKGEAELQSKMDAKAKLYCKIRGL